MNPGLSSEWEEWLSVQHPLERWDAEGDYSISKAMKDALWFITASLSFSFRKSQPREVIILEWAFSCWNVLNSVSALLKRTGKTQVVRCEKRQWKRALLPGCTWRWGWRGGKTHLLSSPSADGDTFPFQDFHTTLVFQVLKTILKQMAIKNPKKRKSLENFNSIKALKARILLAAKYIIWWYEEGEKKGVWL